MFKKYKNQDLDMTFWWKKHPKDPADYIKYITEQIGKISSAATIEGKKRAQEDCSKYLMGTKCFILEEIEPKPTLEAMERLFEEIYKNEFFYHMLQNFSKLEFEARKEVMFLYSICLKHSKDNKYTTVDHLILNPKTINVMLRSTYMGLLGQAPRDIFLFLGNMIIESVKYEQLCSIILKDPELWKFFEFGNLPDFEISTESLQILTAVFTTHPKLVSKEFFNNEYNISKFIEKINYLIYKGSYVTRRQITKLLASLIIIRSNNTLMTEYISSSDNLKLIMILMSDKSKNLQLEAFNIFKVIVANPKKPKSVLDILIKNKVKLLNYFSTFGNANHDATFIDEKDFIIQEIESLPTLVFTLSEVSVIPPSTALSF